MTPPQPFRDRLLEFLRRPGSTAAPLPHSDGIDHRSEAPGPGPAAMAPPPGPSPAELREQFAAAQKKAGGEVVDLSGSPDPRRALLDVLRSLAASGGEARGGGGAPVAAASAPRAAIDRDPSWEAISRRDRGPGDLISLAREAGFEVQQVPVRGREDTIEWLSRAALGITVADHAIADTGTVAQLARSFRPRSISLLPPAHLVILPSERLLPSMADLLAAVSGDLGGPAGYMTLISGPSRTADIEKVLTIGIHGPGRFVVVIVA